MRRAYITLAASALLAGCSLMGLDDGLTRETCSVDADCDDLNKSNPTGNACSEWRCNAETSFCEALPFDGDGDAYPSASCAGEGDTPDCDDENAERYPGNAELCDNVDNDCDDSVDENLYSAGGAMRLTALTSAGARHVHMSPVTSSDTVAVAYTDGGGATGAQKVAFPSATSTDSARTLALEDESQSPIALAASRDVMLTPMGNDFAAVIVPAGACQRGVTGITTENDASLELTSAAFSAGIPKATDTCDADTSSMSDPVISALGTGALVAWVDRNDTNGPSATWDCDGATSSNVLINLVEKSGNQLVPVNALALPLGTTSSPTPPAVVAVPGYGWVVAFADDVEDAVLLYGVVDASGSLEVTDEPLASVARSEGEFDGALGDVTLAFTATSESKVTLGVAFREGCSTSSAIHVRLVDFTPGDGTATLKEADWVLGDKKAKHEVQRPSLAYLPSGGWFVAWEDASKVNTRTIQVRRLATTEAATADAPFEVIVGDDGDGTNRATGFGEGVLIRPQTDGTSLGVLTMATIDDEPGIFGAVIECTNEQPR
ncbi:MAG: MopE-related protein [Polyangiales bacterium]|nr:hypothetical protein [Myxococcales bacterium]